MSVATIVYTGGHYWWDFQYLAKRLNTQIWSTPESKLRATMRAIKLAVEFLQQAQSDDYLSYFPVVNRPQPSEYAMDVFKHLGKPYKTEEDRKAHQQTLGKYLQWIRRLEIHLPKGTKHNVPKKALTEMAEFFATVGQLDKEIVERNRSRERHRHGCF